MRLERINLTDKDKEEIKDWWDGMWKDKRNHLVPLRRIHQFFLLLFGNLATLVNFIHAGRSVIITENFSQFHNVDMDFN